MSSHRELGTQTNFDSCFKRIKKLTEPKKNFKKKREVYINF